MKLTAFLRLCLISLIASSCGSARDFFDKTETYSEKEIANISKGTPIVYPRADPTCDASNAVDKLGDESGSVKVWVGNKGEVKLVSVKVEGISGHGLQSEAIADTIWGREMSYDISCSSKADLTSVCTDPQRTVRKEGQRLFFCKAEGDYPRESLENVALASLIGVMKTHSVHKTVFPREKIQKVTLLIHPLIVDHKFIDNEEIKNSVSFDVEQVRTDNAYWFPNKGQDFIAAVPESIESSSLKSANDPRIWEMPSIMSHEYGHHLFHHYAPSLANPMGSDLVSYSPQIDLATSAINEGFADLIAYFTASLEYPEIGWFSLSNVFFNREVSKPHCSDGSQKKLDDLFLYHYFNQTPNLPLNRHIPDPTDDHAVGAVLAHGLFRIFNSKQTMGGKPSDSDLRRSYHRTIEWAKELNKNFKEDAKKQARVFLNESLHRGLLVMKDLSGENIFDNHCSIIHEVFPVFPELVKTCQSLVKP